MKNDLHSAITECSRWGISVRLFSRENNEHPSDFGVKHHAPIHFGGITPDGTIFFKPRTRDREPGMDACGLIHEMVHVIMMRRLGEPPYEHDEPRMLALESECWRRLRLRSAAWMYEYAIENGEEWRDLPTIERGRILAESRHYLTGLGLMRHGKPTYEVPSCD